MPDRPETEHAEPTPPQRPAQHPPAREPYYEGYFGTEEEEGVERERQAPEEDADEKPRIPPPDAP